MMPLVLLALLVAAFVGTVRSRRRPFGRVLSARAEAALFVGVALVLPLTVWHWSVSRSVPRRVAALVSPYPGADEPQDAGRALALEPGMLAMRGDSGGARRALESLRESDEETYLMHSTDPAERVLAYYRDPSHRAGWELAEDDSLLLILRRPGRELLLGAHDEGFGRGTRIIYDVYRRP